MENVIHHLKNIYSEEELNEAATTIEKLEKRMTAAERSINSIIYTRMPPLQENRRKIGFHP